MRSDPTIIVTCDRCGVSVQVDFGSQEMDLMSAGWKIEIMEDYCPWCRDKEEG